VENKRQTFIQTRINPFLDKQAMLVMAMDYLEISIHYFRI
jgi:hypothetical protein